MAAIDDIRREASRLYVASGFGTITSSTLIRATGLHPQQFVDALRERYEQRQKVIEAEYNLHPPMTALLREDVTRKMPFLEERAAGWKNFQPSDDDWIRCITLPLEITPDVAEMLGLYRSAFTMDSRRRHYVMDKQPSPLDAKFYRSYVVPRINRMHNLDLHYEPHDAGKDSSKDEIRISSEAIVTWLMDDLEFPDISYFFSLPDGARHSFLEGFLAGSGYRDGRVGLVTTFTEDDSKYIEQFEKVANGLGLHPKVNANNMTIRFSGDDLRKVALLNPRHQR